MAKREPVRKRSAGKTTSRVTSRSAATEGFWDRPVLMNLVSDVLIAFGIATLAWAAVNGLQHMPFKPLREVVVVSDIERVSRAQIEHAARTAVSGNLLGVNIENARATFEKLPWVRRAEVRRRWPDSLELTLEEHVAVARWSRAGASDSQDERLVNAKGELFVANSSASLPLLSGPEGSSAVMLDRFRAFDASLEKIKRKPVAVTLTAREAWQVRLDDGVMLDLGRDQPRLPLAERLERFNAYYAAAREKTRAQVAAVDMRYPNGFVLRLGAPASPDRKSKES